MYYYLQVCGTEYITLASIPDTGTIAIFHLLNMAEEINELTQCPICFERYEEDGDHVPRILPCHCTLCQECIVKLLKNNVLECPQDRQKHKAERGVKSFSQNKYVIAYLRKDVKQQDSEYEECTEHSLKMVLYCKH